MDITTLLLHIEAEALLIAARARALREALHDGRPVPAGKIRRLCAWLYRLACEVEMAGGGDRPPKVYPPIETEALGYSADQARGWRWMEMARRVCRWWW